MTLSLKEFQKFDPYEPISVSSYINSLNEQLRNCEARLIGETGQISMSRNGHVYFSLKDPQDQSVIRCVIWNSNYKLCGIELKEGMEIIIFGHPDIYPSSGNLTFKVQTVELVGEGILKEQYEKLKRKLELEGIFSAERKRQVPEYVQRVGVITSLQGAVIHDFTSNLRRFGSKIEAIDSNVEGQRAIRDLLQSIQSFRKRSIDVLVIIRGGGSLESLMAFNNEMLVREIVQFPVPVVVGIGHHKDVPLIALAADVMVSTPTAAANLLSESWQRGRMNLEKCEKLILRGFNVTLSETRQNLNQLLMTFSGRLQKLLDRYRNIRSQLRLNIVRIHHSVLTERKSLKNNSIQIIKGHTGLLSRLNSQLEALEKNISLNDPIRQLKLGYSIAWHRGRILRSIKSLKLEDVFDLQVFDGIVSSKVTNLKKTKK